MLPSSPPQHENKTTPPKAPPPFARGTCWTKGRRERAGRPRAHLRVRGSGRGTGRDSAGGGPPGSAPAVPPAQPAARRFLLGREYPPQPRFRGGGGRETPRGRAAHRGRARGSLWVSASNTMLLSARRLLTPGPRGRRGSHGDPRGGAGEGGGGRAQPAGCPQPPASPAATTPASAAAPRAPPCPPPHAVVGPLPARSWPRPPPLSNPPSSLAAPPGRRSCRASLPGAGPPARGVLRAAAARSRGSGAKGYGHGCREGAPWSPPLAALRPITSQLLYGRRATLGPFRLGAEVARAQGPPARPHLLLPSREDCSLQCRSCSLLPGCVDGEVGTASPLSSKCQTPGHPEHLITMKSARRLCSPGTDTGGGSSLWRWRQTWNPVGALSLTDSGIPGTSLTCPKQLIIDKMGRTVS